MITPNTLLDAYGLTCRFTTPAGVSTAIDSITMSIATGEAVGIVGESGSGKSVLVRSIMGLLRGRGITTDGTVIFDGVDLADLPSRRLRDVWGAQIAMVFQDSMSSLDPVMTIGRQITEVLERHRVAAGRAARLRAIGLLRDVGINDPERRFRQYPHELSGGMRQRVSIAIALSCDPKLLLADEPTTALDVTVQAQVLDLLDDLRSQRSMALALVTHDLGVVAGRTDRIIVMYAGQIVESAPTADLFNRVLHPYTQLLLESIPRIDDKPGAPLAGIPGRPPSLLRPPAGCRFADRCPIAQPRCHTEAPTLDLVPGSTHQVRCWYPGGTTSTVQVALREPQEVQ